MGFPIVKDQVFLRGYPVGSQRGRKTLKLIIGFDLNGKTKEPTNSYPVFIPFHSKKATALRLEEWTI